MEIVSAILYQLTRNLTPEEIKASGFDTYFVDHTTGIYPVAASGTPFTAAYFQSKGDPITDLVEDMAAIKFLREREIVHFQRFGEGLRITQDNLNSKNFYACNPAFDKQCGKNCRR